MIARLCLPLALPLLGGLCLAACGTEQAAECARYVVCQAAYDEAFAIEPPTDTAAYDEGGDCWVNEATAQTCQEHCQRATGALGAAASQAGSPLGVCDG